ncbi:hypothetical protein MMC18_009198 [Xylographa bjoerkii]|nr:hypothetical protein [Xylographa bjoerkii]
MLDSQISDPQEQNNDVDTQPVQAAVQNTAPAANEAAPGLEPRDAVQQDTMSSTGPSSESPSSTESSITGDPPASNTGGAQSVDTSYVPARQSVRTGSPIQVGSADHPMEVNVDISVSPNGGYRSESTNSESSSDGSSSDGSTSDGSGSDGSTGLGHNKPAQVT